MKARIVALTALLVPLLAACEDQGNPGDDNLLTGVSLIVVLVIALIVGIVLVRRR
jgi:hypothetical protein